MTYLNKRQLIIIKHLLNSEKPVSSGYLATILGVNSKTIKNDMNVVSQIMPFFGAKLISKSGTGYYIEVVDRNDYNTFVQIFNTRHKDYYSFPALNAERVKNIIVRFLTAKDYIKLETLKDDMYFSRTTISSDLKDVKSVLESYGLTLKTKPSYGMKIVGTEFCLRHIMADFLNTDEDDNSAIDDIYVGNYDYLELKNTLIRNLSAAKIIIAGSSLNKIINLIYISLYRFKQGFYLDIDKKEIEEQNSMPEYELAVNLFKDLAIGLLADEREILFLALFIASRRTIIQDDDVHLEKDKRLYKLSYNIADYIYGKIEVDLFHDMDLRINLCYHLRGLIFRLKYSIQKKHLPLMSIKQTSPAFEFAVLASEYLFKELKLKMGETEIAYLAYVFESYYAKYVIQRKIKILIIMEGGRVVAQNFANYIHLNFGNQIENLKIIEFYQLDYTNIEDYNCILTDIPNVNFSSPIPVAQLYARITPEDKAKLVAFFAKMQYRVKDFLNCFSEELFFTDVDVSSKEGAIEYLCDKLLKMNDVSANIAEMVMYRESVSSTERESLVALPHSLFCAGQNTYIAVGILRRPILWDKQYVSVVFLTSLGSFEMFPYWSLEILNTFLANSAIAYEILSSSSYEYFIGLFE